MAMIAGTNDAEDRYATNCIGGVVESFSRCDHGGIAIKVRCPSGELMVMEDTKFGMVMVYE